MSKQTLEVKAIGLWTSPNKLSPPPGALAEARNVVSRKPNVISRRRGRERSQALDNPPSALAEYLGFLIVLDGDTLKWRDPDTGDWTPITGSFTPPTGKRMSFLEANGNLYFTTDAGVYVLDSLDGTPVRSGIPAGLDIRSSLTGAGGGFFLPDSQVGYRPTFKRTDANENTKQGAPGPQERLTNLTYEVTWSRAATTATIAQTGHGYATSDVIEVLVSDDSVALPTGSYTITVTGADAYTITVPNAGGLSGDATVGKAFNATLEVTLPDELQVGDVLELWRTPLSATASDNPGDDHRLIQSVTLTSSHLSAGVVTVVDELEDVFFKENLYTNAGLADGGLAQANARPPLCSHLAFFDTHTFYFDAEQPYNVRFQLISVDDLGTITLTADTTDETYTADTAESVNDKEFKVFDDDLLSVNIERTAKSLVHIINRASALFYADYISGFDDAPGQILITKRDLAGTLIEVEADDTDTSAAFTPLLPYPMSTVPALQSTNNAKPNGAWRSKSNEPEAVPTLNFELFGKKQKLTLGVRAIKEAILVYRQDGLFSLAGSTDGASGAAFRVDEVDPTVILKGPNTLALIDNACGGYTTQGAVRTGAGPVLNFSAPAIDDDLRRLATHPDFETLAHAVGYESENSYLLFLPEFRSDTTATIAYVYNFGTNFWSIWDWFTGGVACAHVLSTDDRLYLGHSDEPYVLIERKDLNPNGADFVDEALDATITVVAGTQVTLTSAVEPEFGWILEQGFGRSVITAVEDAGPMTFTVTLRKAISGLTTGACTLGIAIRTDVEWSPISAGNPAALKQVSYAQVYLERAGGTHQLGFCSNLKSAMEFTGLIARRKSSGWGAFPWGSLPWGSTRPGANPPLRTLVPQEHQLCESLSVRYRNLIAREPVDILVMSLDVRPISTVTQQS